MVNLALDTEKLIKLLRARGKLSEMAYPDMTDEQAAEIFERLKSDPSFDEMVRECVYLDCEPRGDID